MAWWVPWKGRGDKLLFRKNFIRKVSTPNCHYSHDEALKQKRTPLALMGNVLRRDGRHREMLCPHSFGLSVSAQAATAFVLGKAKSNRFPEAALLDLTSSGRPVLRLRLWLVLLVGLCFLSGTESTE